MEIQSIPRMKTVAESQHTCSSGEHLGEGETLDPHSQHGTSHADCRVSGSTRRVPGDGQDTASKARADQGMTQDQQGNSTLLLITENTGASLPVRGNRTRPCGPVPPRHDLHHFLCQPPARGKVSQRVSLIR